MHCWIIPVGHFHTRASVLDPSDTSDTWLDIPVYAYLVKTADNLVLFDTGCSEQLGKNPTAILGEEAQILVPRMGPEDYITRALARVGVSPDDVDVVALSHLHFDHAGGNRAFARAEFVIQEAEWEAALADDAGLHYPDSAWRPVSDRIRLVSGDVELAPGLSLISTPGHTPGHQSLLVELPTRPLLITADAVYREALFDPAHVGAAVDVEQARRSVARLRALAQDGYRPFFSHDPAQWREPWVRLAPDALA